MQCQKNIEEGTPPPTTVDLESTRKGNKKRPLRFSLSRVFGDFCKVLLSHLNDDGDLGSRSWFVEPAADHSCLSVSSIRVS